MSPPTRLLDSDEAPSAVVVNEGGRSRYVLLCEHASNLLPKALGGLGLPPSELQRHIAWDLGAEQLARRLSRHCPALRRGIAPTTNWGSTRTGKRMSDSLAGK